jgi:hypothetical protein
MAYMHKELNDMTVIPAPAGVATPYVQHQTEDGITLAYGTTKPTDAATGYAPGCTFVDTDSGAVYINEGTAASADFNQTVTVENIDSAVSASDVVGHVDATETAGTAAGAGPSPLIWNDAKVLEAMLDPTAGIYYFDDYLGPIDPTTACGYVVTQVNSGVISTVADEDGGVLLVDSGGHNAADDGVSVQLTNCMFKPVAGRTIRFEARVKFNDNSANTSQFAIGLAGIDTTVIAAGVLDDTVDKALWFHHAASTADKMSVCAARTSAEDIDADKATTVDDTYIKLGFVINGLTSIEWYANGVLVHTSSEAANIPNAVMCLTYVAQVEGTSADSEMSVDWVRILQEGTRS